MVHLNLRGDAFIGKYRADGEIVQLGLLTPSRSRSSSAASASSTCYTIDGRADTAPLTSCTSRACRWTGCAACRRSRSAGWRCALRELAGARQPFFEQGSCPSGILTAEPATGTGRAARRDLAATHGGVERMHRIAVLAGDVQFTPIALSADDSQFLQQRELSAREVARIFRVPAWAIDAPDRRQPDLQQRGRAEPLPRDPLAAAVARADRAGDLERHRPVSRRHLRAVRPRRAVARRRRHPLARSTPRALDPETGWMRRDEIRELEELEPERAA